MPQNLRTDASEANDVTSREQQTYTYSDSTGVRTEHRYVSSTLLVHDVLLDVAGKSGETIVARYVSLMKEGPFPFVQNNNNVLFK